LIRRELEAVVHLDAISDVEVLSQTAGYGVARLHVPGGSPLSGLPLRDSGLRQQEIIVLFIDRGGAAIPLPAADRTIHTGDSMICFGLLERIARYGSRRSKKTDGPTAE
jgi:Trk K+ transport system NAD-binding subunit